MLQKTKTPEFQSLNQGYSSVFQSGNLSLGLVVPVEHYPNGPVPSMQAHVERVQLAEKLGFSSVWLRDVPFNVPTFGDAGQVFDPFVYLGLLAGQTKRIALGVASVVLPLRHPVHVAKAAASVDVLSNGRLLLGVASGDRAQEFPALNLPYAKRGQDFRESFAYIRKVADDFPRMTSAYGSLNGDIDLLPKPSQGRLPLLVTGASQQSNDWIAEHADGWILYPRHMDLQAKIIDDWYINLQARGRSVQPVMEPLYIDLEKDPNAKAQPIHLGIRAGVKQLIAYLKQRQEIGVNHIALNLRFNQIDIDTSLQRLANEVLPHFN